MSSLISWGDHRTSAWNALFIREQPASCVTRTLGDMQLRKMKVTFSLVWVLGVAAAGIASGATSGSLLVFLAAMVLLPPIAMMLLWNDPAQTMAESIREGRR
jgi:predicted Co/Zn/Cd cation transporter (cation efflux family)